eukprot:3734000-Lingulodinium_polyedra.AAC.1
MHLRRAQCKARPPKWLRSVKAMQNTAQLTPAVAQQQLSPAVAQQQPEPQTIDDDDEDDEQDFEEESEPSNSSSITYGTKVAETTANYY